MSLFVTHSVLFAVLLIAGCLAAFSALILAVDALQLNYSKQRPAESRMRAAFLIWTLVLAIAMCVTHIGLVLVTLPRAREVAKSAVSAANLRGIGQALTLYIKENTDYPPTFDELVADGFATPKQLVTPFDSAFPGESTSPPYYSSFVYRPPDTPKLNDPELIVAYERKPASPLDVRLIPKRGRWVLYADGHVDIHDTEEFERALQKDEQRRRELGWAIPLRP